MTAGLGVALAQSGARTLLISGDLRSPNLHEYFGTSPSMGLAEILGGDTHEPQALTATIDSAIHGVRSRLDIISSATKRTDAVNLLSSPTLDAFFQELAHREYEYVLVDAPPLLGIADSRLLAGEADGVLVVGRPARLTAELALDMQEALSTLESRVLGLVVVGAEGEHPMYGERDDYLDSDAERFVDDDAEPSTLGPATTRNQTWS